MHTQLLLLAATLFMIGCSASNSPKPATSLSSDELSSLIAQYEQEHKEKQKDN